MHVSEIEVTKAKVNLLCLVRPLQKIIVVSKAYHNYLWSLGDILQHVSGPSDSGAVRPPSPPRHDTTAPEETTPARVQPPRQAKTKDAEFHYTK